EEIALSLGPAAGISALPWLEAARRRGAAIADPLSVDFLRHVMPPTLWRDGRRDLQKFRRSRGGPRRLSCPPASVAPPHRHRADRSRRHTRFAQFLPPPSPLSRSRKMYR